MLNRRAVSPSPGFTLIELLVVIAIISLLVSILMPSLSRAKYLARQVVCLSNIRSQYLAQMLYASENDGRFPEHNSSSPEYVRDYGGLPSGKYEMVYDLMMGTYITDANVMICPLQAVQFGLWYADVEYYAGGYGGWGAVKPGIGQNPSAIMSGYLWFANFRWVNGTSPEFEFTSAFDGIDVNEPRWPDKAAECSADRAFITHDVTFMFSESPSFWWDDGHGGSHRTDGAEAFRTKDMPVGYADGHVEVHSGSNIRPRAKFWCYYNRDYYY